MSNKYAMPCAILLHTIYIVAYSHVLSDQPKVVAKIPTIAPRKRPPTLDATHSFHHFPLASLYQEQSINPLFVSCYNMHSISSNASLVIVLFETNFSLKCFCYQLYVTCACKRNVWRSHQN